MVRVNIEIPDALHRLAKSKASLEGMKFKDFIILSIKEKVGEDK